jgi:hypothetical protein
MRMLYRRFFFATTESCQSEEMNTWRKKIDNGRHRMTIYFRIFSKRHKKSLDD